RGEHASEGVIEVIELAGRNVVVLGRFNPAIPSDIWLINHGGVTQDEFDARVDRIMTPVFSKLQTAEFDLLITEDRLQLTLLQTERAAEIVTAKIGAITGTLPHTPYAAIGFNYVYNVIPNGDPRRFLRDRFFHGGTAFARALDNPDAYYGCIV